ncbi:UDP-N-acetylglucosamine 2-epimerase [Candidatus Pelagibacter sp. HIMB1748]|uniref:UDP-N-acetylglucosamine 2-epimerase n=1 Tax=unclassified Candidatus Pelagibacter TaxID=2647897 RepID=UPI003F827BA2
MKKKPYKKKICIISTSRADYDLLKHFVKQCLKSPYYKTYFIVTGSHLEKKSYSISNIIKDKIDIYKKVKINLSSDNNISISKSNAVSHVKFSKIFSKLRPEFIVLLGDRIEILPIAYSAFLQNIKIIHFNGGESTLGILDDGVRNAVTSLSNYHFVAHKNYKDKIMHMGKDLAKIFTVGSLSIDNCKNSKIFLKSKIENRFGFKFKKKNFLVTYHPNNLEKKLNINDLNNMLKSIKKNLSKDNLFIFTGGNIDPLGIKNLKIIKKFIKENYQNCIFVENFGGDFYLSTLNHVDCLIGNSSSGILEAPSYKKPVVNIGSRQGGRVKANNVIDVNGRETEISAAIKKAISKKFQKKIKNLKSPFDKGLTSINAIKIINKF